MKNDLEELSETKHEELLALINPLIDFMVANEYNYFLVAGKDGTCTRHLRGTGSEVAAMISGMMKTEFVKDIINDAINDFDEHEGKESKV